MNDEIFDLQCGEIFISKNLNFRIVCVLCEKKFDFDEYLDFKEHCLKFNCSIDVIPETRDIQLLPASESSKFNDLNSNENFKFTDYELSFIDLDTISLLDGIDTNNKTIETISNSIFSTNDTTNDNKYRTYDTESTISNYIPQNTINSSHNIEINETNQTKTKYQCKYCDKSYYTCQALKLHEDNKHINKLNLICDICKMEFFSLTTLHYHKKFHKNEKDFKCTECEKKFLRKFHLKKHIDTVHKNIRNFKCNECNKKFAHRSLLKRHEITHIGVKLHHCNLCNIKYSTQYSLFSHERSYHPELIPIECAKCKKRFRTQKFLQLHKCKDSNAIRNENKINKLKEIDKNPLISDNKADTLNCGVKIVNSKELPIFIRKFKSITLLPKLHMCEICGKTFRSLSECKIHKRNHLDVKPFNCTDCQKSFIRKNLLIMHQRTHTGEKPYKCTECEKHFRIYSRLKIHIRSHTGERPFKCEICQKGFYAGHNLKTHVKNVHKI